MPRKSFQDGPCATVQEAEALVSAWDAHASLRDGAMAGQRLLADRLGKPVVLPNLGNIGQNYLVLQEIAQSMKSRKRLSSDPIEVLAVATHGWYNKYNVSFTAKDFNIQVWAFRDAWLLHKMFTLLRGKVTKLEKPKDASLNYQSSICSVLVNVVNRKQQHVRNTNSQDKDAAIVWELLVESMTARKEDLLASLCMPFANCHKDLVS